MKISNPRCFWQGSPISVCLMICLSLCIYSLLLFHSVLLFVGWFFFHFFICSSFALPAAFYPSMFAGYLWTQTEIQRQTMRKAWCNYKNRQFFGTQNRLSRGQECIIRLTKMYGYGYGYLLYYYLSKYNTSSLFFYLGCIESISLYVLYLNVFFKGPFAGCRNKKDYRVTWYKSIMD